MTAFALLYIVSVPMAIWQIVSAPRMEDFHG